jgi:large subunit ribosomal protein L19
MQRLDPIVGSFTNNTKSKKIPEFKAGDKVVVKSKIKEGDKERVQAFEGVVIARQGRGASASFTVRKVSAGIGVERIYPLYSPNIVSIDRKIEGFVRRAKLYYIRGLDGKAARIKDKNIRLMEAQGTTATAAAGGEVADQTTESQTDATTTAGEESAKAPKKVKAKKTKE